MTNSPVMKLVFPAGGEESVSNHMAPMRPYAVAVFPPARGNNPIQNTCPRVMLSHTQTGNPVWSSLVTHDFACASVHMRVGVTVKCYLS